MSEWIATPCTAFAGDRLLASGKLGSVALAVKKWVGQGAQEPILVFDDHTSALIDLDLRGTAADVVHGFLIDGTNVNTMLVPGYISTITTRFDTPGERHMPCHEFCGTGHEGMWGNVKVIDKADFLKMAADRRRLNCVE